MKKQYLAPATSFVEMHATSHLLAGSGLISISKGGTTNTLVDPYGE